MSDLEIYLVLGSVATLLVVVVIGWLFARTNKIKLTQTPKGQKPEWMQSMPPQDTVKATTASSQGIGVFGQEAGEQLAAPFAEQIEDIIHAALAADPKLKSYQVDFGTAADGGLEIHVNGQVYRAVKDIPVEPVRAVIEQAIAKYNE